MAGSFAIKLEVFTVMRININYFAKEALVSFLRNWAMSLVAVTTVAICLFIAGFFFYMYKFVVSGVQGIESKVLVEVFLKDTAPPEKINALQNEVLSWEEIANNGARYISKDDAMNRLKRDLKDSPEMLEQIEGNPLPASLELKFKDPRYVDKVVKRLAGRPEIDGIRNDQKLVDRLLLVTGWIRIMGLIFAVLLGLASVVLIFNTIKLAIFARRNEIAIMKLVGASNWFIRWPFILEGVGHGILGAFLAVFSIYLVRATLLKNMAEDIDIISRLVKVTLSTPVFVNLVLGLILAGILIGAIGSLSALRQFLKGL